jgi:hypothetical protein
MLDAGATVQQQADSEVMPTTITTPTGVALDSQQQAVDGHTRLQLQLSFVHPVSRHISAADRAQLARAVAQVVTEVAGACAQEASGVKVQLEGLKPGRCAGDPLTVTLVVSFRGKAVPAHPDQEPTAAVLQELALCQQALPLSLGTLDMSQSSIRILAVPGPAARPNHALTGSLADVKKLLLPEAADSSKQHSNSADDKDAVSTSSTAPAPPASQSSAQDNSQALVPVTATEKEVVPAPALPLPYAGYTLVDLSGRPLERPTKHPFALSRVYYSAAEVPSDEQQVRRGEAMAMVAVKGIWQGALGRRASA